MITTLDELGKIKNSVVFTIDIFRNLVNEEYLKKLDKFLTDQLKIYNIYTDKITDITFTKEVRKLKKQKNKALNLQDVKNLFPVHQHQTVYDQLINIPEDNTSFETIYSDYYIYLNRHQWLYIEKEFAAILKQIKNNNQTLIIIGYLPVLNYFYLMAQKFNITVYINNELSFSEKMPQPVEKVKENKENIRFENIHLNSYSDQHDYRICMYSGLNKVAYANYTVFKDKVYIQNIEAIVKNKEYGFNLMLKLADMYGYENIERNYLTPDGKRLRQKLDKHFNFDYEKHKEKQNKHLSINVIDQVRKKYPLIADLMSDICIFGHSGWDKHRPKIDEIIKQSPLDINDVTDICQWIKNSATNDNLQTDEVPDYINDYLNLLIH